MIKLIKRLFQPKEDMATQNMKKFVATQGDLEAGVGQLSHEEKINAIIAYKKQNPAKFEAKKDELYRKYGLNEIPTEVEDEVVKELEAKKSAVKKVNIV